MITVELEQIKNIAEDIKADKEWVNDSESKAEHRGICMGLDLLINHLEEVDEWDMLEEEDDERME